MNDISTTKTKQKNKIKIRLGKVQKRLTMPSIGLGFGGLNYRWKRAGLLERLFGSFSIRASGAMNPHIALVGESGSGKSNAAKVLVKGLCENGINTIIFDPHGEYADTAEAIGARIYDAKYNGINIFDFDGMDLDEKLSDLGSMFKKIFKLGDVQSYVLHKCLKHMYNRCEERGRQPSTFNLLLSIRTFTKFSKDRDEQKALKSLERRFSIIDNASFSRSTDISKMLASRSIILLSGLHSTEAQGVYMEGLLRKLYTRMLSMEKSPRARLYLVVDEAEKLEGSAMLGKIAAEGRKYGIGLVTIAQRAKVMGSDIRANASLFISFYNREPEELNYTSNLIAGGIEFNRFTAVKRAIRNLHRGEAVVLDAAKQEPTVVRFDAFRSGRPNLEYSITKAARSAAEGRALVFKMQGLGFDSDEIRQKIETMLDAKTLSQYLFQTEPYKGTWYIAMNRNSAEHDISVAIISRHLFGKGVPNRIYNSSYGPDIIASAGGEKIAVEYETGLKDIGETVKMVERRGRYFKKTLLIVNDAQARRYEVLQQATVIAISDFIHRPLSSVLSTNFK